MRLARGDPHLLRTIRNAVETVRTLVDEFSRWRVSASRPQPASLNHVVETALLMFNGRLEGFACAPNWRRICRKCWPIGSDQARGRESGGYAAEAMQDAILKEITISTALVGSRDAVELAVSDTGQEFAAT